MEIGIVGTGSVGSALARGFTAAGQTVALGSRDPGAANPDLDGADVPVVAQRAAVRDADVAVLAIPAAAATTVAADLADALAGTVVVDATNEYPDPTGERSVAERVAEAAPDAHVVKAFNTIGHERMTDPVVDGDRATMFVAGDEGAEAVESLAADLGFDPLRAGDLSAARRLEDLARLWIDLSGEYGRTVAFRLLRE